MQQIIKLTHALYQMQQTKKRERERGQFNIPPTHQMKTVCNLRRFRHHHPRQI